MELNKMEVNNMEVNKRFLSFASSVIENNKAEVAKHMPSYVAENHAVVFPQNFIDSVTKLADTDPEVQKTLDSIHSFLVSYKLLKTQNVNNQNNNNNTNHDCSKEYMNAFSLVKGGRKRTRRRTKTKGGCSICGVLCETCRCCCSILCSFGVIEWFYQNCFPRQATLPRQDPNFTTPLRRPGQGNQFTPVSSTPELPIAPFPRYVDDLINTNVPEELHQHFKKEKEK